MNQFTKVNKEIEKAVVSGYKAIENGFVGCYKKVEDAFTGASAGEPMQDKNDADTKKSGSSSVVSTYKTIENGVISGYKAIEDTFVSGYKKIKDKFVESFLTPDEAEQNRSDVNADTVGAEGDEKSE